MASFLGGCLGVWTLYAVFALIFKHKKGLIISAIWGLLSGVAKLIGAGDFTILIAVVISLGLIYSIIPIQIKSEEKEAWKERRNKNK